MSESLTIGFQPSILLVDDDALNLDVLKEILQEEPYDLVQARSGSEALGVIRTSRKSFDVIVLDRMMPNMNGLEVMACLKLDEQTQWIPVIMATAAGTPQEMCEGVEAGVFFYLIKPFEADTLRRMVRVALEERNKWRTIRQSLAAPSQSVRFMQHGHFLIRTMEEATALGIFLGQACENPDKVAFGLSELLCNAVEHGNLSIGFHEKTRLQEENRWEAEIERRLGLPENLGKTVGVQVERVSELLTITITDEGVGFDWKEYEVLQPERMFESHGRGIAMAKAMSFEKMEYYGKGNQVRCVVRSKSSRLPPSAGTREQPDCSVASPGGQMNGEKDGEGRTPYFEDGLEPTIWD